MPWTVIAFLLAGALVFSVQLLFHARNVPDDAPDINRMLLNAVVFAGGLTLLAHVTAG